MPSVLAYPGVYVEEVSSGVRTIMGVGTSTAAFVGRARRGPVDEPVTIHNFGDFERSFGGLWAASTMSYAVRDFFRNGGNRAIIVRVFQGASGVNDPAAKIIVPIDAAKGLTLTAVDPGEWGNMLRARVDHDVAPGDPTLFNLHVALVRRDADGAVKDIAEPELFRNVSLKATHPRRVDRVLESQSRLVRAKLPDGFTADARPPSHENADAKNPLWGHEKGQADKTSVGVAGGDERTDGADLSDAVVTGPGLEGQHKGLYALDGADLFNLLCISPLVRGAANSNDLVEAAIAYCTARRAIFLIDGHPDWNNTGKAVLGIKAEPAVVGSASRNAAIYFPWLRAPDPLRENQLDDFPPCGAVAGVIARTDTARGVWKAPAGLETVLVGVPDLTVRLTDADIGELNPLGINCLRPMPDAGRVVWGARTREGSDRLASEWKYLPVRRLTLYIEESLFRGTQWVVFEPNDEPLWASIRLNIGSFMHTLHRQGAFQGKSAQEAYDVKCDRETTTQSDIDRGVVNIVVRFAPLKPAEFVVIKIQQMAGQVQA